MSTEETETKPTKRVTVLTEEEISEFRDIFNLVDRDGGGSISNGELGELMETLGINATADEIAEMIKEIDEDSNGEIDFEEFVAVMSRKVNATYTPVDVKSAFKVGYTTIYYTSITLLARFRSINYNLSYF